MIWEQLGTNAATEREALVGLAIGKGLQAMDGEQLGGEQKITYHWVVTCKMPDNEKLRSFVKKKQFPLKTEVICVL